MDPSPVPPINLFAVALNKEVDLDLSVHFPDCNGVLIIIALLFFALPL